MGLLIVFMLSCTSVLSADTGLRVVTTTRTNAETAIIYRTDVYTRDGQTNLVRRTKTKAGVVQVQVHRFYYRGALVGDYLVMPDSSGLTTEDGCPYSVSIQFWPSKEVRSVVFGTNGVVLDAFMATNGVLYPADSALIHKANEIGGDVAKLLSPAHVTNTPPADFVREAGKRIEKHRDK